jgi:hypothetical protein
MAAFASTCYAGTSLGDQHSVPLLHGQLFFWSSISRDIIEIMPIAALMSANVDWSLGSNINFTLNASGMTMRKYLAPNDAKMT